VTTFKPCTGSNPAVHSTSYLIYRHGHQAGVPALGPGTCSQSSHLRLGRPMSCSPLHCFWRASRGVRFVSGDLPTRSGVLSHLPRSACFFHVSFTLCQATETLKSLLLLIISDCLQFNFRACITCHECKNANEKLAPFTSLITVPSNTRTPIL
jgi:hypothetical protein